MGDLEHSSNSTNQLGRIASAEALALARMQQRAADFIITDIIMPKLNGVETSAATREYFSDAPEAPARYDCGLDREGG